MGFKLPRLSMAQLILAAKGEFEIDVTDEMRKAFGMDAEAQTLGLLTKSEAIGNSETDKLLTRMDSNIDAITAALVANNKAIMEAAMPLQPQGDVLKVLSDIRAEIAGMKADIAKAVDQFATAVTSLEAVKAEMLSKTPVAGATTGPVTPDMTNFLHAQEDAVKGSKSTSSIFEFDSVQL